MFAVFSRHLSIKKKLVLSMAACLLLFLAISATLSVTLTARGLRARVEEQELPAVVGQIRNDLLRQIASPLSASLGVAHNTFLQAWEAADTPDEGVDAWQTYARQVKATTHAANVFVAMESVGKFITENGVERTLSRATPRDKWLYEFLATGKPYELNLDRDVSTNMMMLFINTRVEAGPGKLGAAGLGLSVDALADEVRAYHVGRSGTVSLVRADGGVLVHRDPAMADGKHFLKDLPGFSNELSTKLLGGARFASATYPSAGGPHIVASSFVPELNVYVVAEVPESEVLGGADPLGDHRSARRRRRRWWHRPARHRPGQSCDCGAGDARCCHARRDRRRTWRSDPPHANRVARRGRYAGRGL